MTNLFYLSGFVIKRMPGLCLAFLFLFLASGCVNLEVPRHEYNLARTAFVAAKESEAPRYSPNLFHKSEKYLRRAEKLFEERDFKRATSYFRKSRYYAERAENVARLKQFKQGEMVP